MMNKVEILGLIATTLITLSYAWTNVKTIRIVNIVGSLFFIAYGILLGAHSVWIANSICTIINVYKLYKGRNEKS